MLWKNLLSAIARYAAAHPDDPGVQTLHTCAKGAGKSIPAYLEATDIRQVGSLKRVVPMAFPRPLRRATELTADLNIHGDWRIYAKDGS